MNIINPTPQYIFHEEDLVGMSVPSLFALRKYLGGRYNFDRLAFNKLIRREMTRKAEIKNADFYAQDKCQVKGHQYMIANGYQSLWNNGVDTPVQCLRCGRIEI